VGEFGVELGFEFAQLRNGELGEVDCVKISFIFRNLERYCIL
jgi:hypothetical protein